MDMVQGLWIIVADYPDDFDGLITLTALLCFMEIIVKELGISRRREDAHLVREVVGASTEQLSGPGVFHVEMVRLFRLLVDAPDFEHIPDEAYTKEQPENADDNGHQQKVDVNGFDSIDKRHEL